MIRRLSIRNYAIIEQLEIDFSDRLTIITGETGAGKSILLGALGLIMGSRADTKTLFNDNEKCVVEGTFDIARYDLKDFFTENDLEYDAELIVRREISPSGKSRAFINDSPATAKMLQDLSGNLIDLHQQFDTLDIHNVSFQLRMLDALAGNKSLLDDYQNRFKRYQSDRRQLEKLREQSLAAAREVDFLQFQLDELTKAELRKGEQEALETELETLSNAEEIKRTLGGIHRHLNDSEQAIVPQLNDALNALNGIKKFHPELPELYQRFSSLTLELDDLASELERVADDTEYDPERISEMQQRLDTIYRLQHKHQAISIEALLELEQDLQNRLDGFSNTDETIAALEKSVQAQDKALREAATLLSQKRQGVIKGFEEKVQGLLAQLSMEHARLRVDMRPLETLSSTGLDEVNFLFSANKGGRFDLIKNVASGGELSRLTLCTKSLVASAIPLPTLIFDEIDTGISGDVALKMGNILRGLSRHHQVVSITHTPQIAATADRHYFVYKTDAGDRTTTSVKQLTPNERIVEIATMLSGNPPSAAALENAKGLLDVGG
jgi:DNA repair protein RecN (Recombination protein N)